MYHRRVINHFILMKQTHYIYNLQFTIYDLHQIALEISICKIALPFVS